MANETGDDVKQARSQTQSFIVGMGFCAALTVVFGAMVFAKGGQPCKIEVRSRINPNVASAVSLARLPGIGMVRANAIVDYRGEYAVKGGDGAAFKGSEDLDKVKGIGPATMQKIKQWLEFEGTEF